MIEIFTQSEGMLSVPHAAMQIEVADLCDVAWIEVTVAPANTAVPAWVHFKSPRLADSTSHLPHAIKVPAASTVHAVLDRHGLVTRAARPRTRAEGTPLSDGLGPNDLWCTDYKGEFQLGDKRYRYPLTVTDHASRYLLLCEAMESNRTELAFQAFERLFRERGLPRAIRSDNGVPFASPHGLFQLSKLSVWWLRLGITIERIQPGHPQQNSYASYCTSSEPFGMTDIVSRRDDSLIPCAFLGQFEPGGSYRCSGLSV